MTIIAPTMLGPCVHSETGWATWVFDGEHFPGCRCDARPVPADEGAAEAVFDEWEHAAKRRLDEPPLSAPPA